jgi:endonuclease YncB( thermonuclease family)
MQTPSLHPRTARHLLAALVLTLATGAASAADAARGIEQALATAQQDKRGITLYVAGQTIGGAVTRIEAGQWVELKSQAAGKIIVRLDRIDAIAAP